MSTCFAFTIFNPTTVEDAFSSVEMACQAFEREIIPKIHQISPTTKNAHARKLNELTCELSQINQKLKMNLLKWAASPSHVPFRSIGLCSSFQELRSIEQSYQNRGRDLSEFVHKSAQNIRAALKKIDEQSSELEGQIFECSVSSALNAQLNYEGFLLKYQRLYQKTQSCFERLRRIDQTLMNTKNPAAQWDPWKDPKKFPPQFFGPQKMAPSFPSENPIAKWTAGAKRAEIGMNGWAAQKVISPHLFPVSEKQKATLAKKETPKIFKPMESSSKFPAGLAMMAVPFGVLALYKITKS